MWKYFLTSLTLHGLISGLAVGWSWSVLQSETSSRDPMQVLILPDDYEIVNAPVTEAQKASASNTFRKVKKSKTMSTVTKQNEISEHGAAPESVANSEVSEDVVGGEKLKLSYKQALNHYITKNRYYPRRARKLRQMGTVMVRFYITPDGQFKHVHLESGCDHEALNKAALQLIEKLGRFKPLPKSLATGDEFVVPIEYRMAGGS